MGIFKIVPPIFGRFARPFLPHKRTSTSTVGMSAKGHALHFAMRKNCGPPRATKTSTPGSCPDDRPWFIGAQFHPELKFRPFARRARCFSPFIAAAVEQSRLVCPAGLIVTRSGSSDQIAEHIVQVVGAGSGAV
jgi:hypothetical protein